MAEDIAAHYQALPEASERPGSGNCEGHLGLKSVESEPESIAVGTVARNSGESCPQSVLQTAGLAEGGIGKGD